MYASEEVRVNPNVEKETGTYLLRLRSTRRIPPKRYDPKFEVPKLMKKLSNMSIEKRPCKKKSRIFKRIEHEKDVFCPKERK